MPHSGLPNKGNRVERSQSLLDRPTSDGKMFKCFPALPLRMSSVKEKNRGKIRLSPSRSAVSFKEMRKFNKANEAFHRQQNLEQTQSHLHILEVLGDQTSAENNSSLESLSNQADENLNHQFYPQAVQTHDLFVDLADELSFENTIAENAENVAQESEDEATTSREVEKPSSDDPTQNLFSFVHSYPLCKKCGQKHRLLENHEYEYTEEIDDDLLCDICLQPFVDPYDTRCGHTFCCVCLKNYVRLKKICPVDRKNLNFFSDCWQSSLVVRRLVDKLSVRCPNSEFCQLVSSRADLSAHLNERCPGSIVQCKFAIFGCNFKAARIHEADHYLKCKFQGVQGDPIKLMYPNCEKHTVEIFRPEGIAELGFTFVGGNDTPLRNIIVQDIFPASLVQFDGRIRTGDIVIGVNGEDFHSVSHIEARTVLSRNSRLMRFTLLRERDAENISSNSAANQEYGEKIAVFLIKPPNEHLGIKLISSDGVSGVFVQEVLPGKIAQTSGLLQAGDRILEISKVDVSNGNSETAARLIQNSGEVINMLICRRKQKPATTIENPWAFGESPSDQDSLLNEKTANLLSDLPPSIAIPKAVAVASSYKKKIVSLQKLPNESLGIVIAGGAKSTGGDLPIFVQEIQSFGVVGKDSRIKCGDLLIEANGSPLNGLSHSQAITVLKTAACNCSNVTLISVELNYPGKDEDFALWDELSGVLHQRSRLCGCPQAKPWTSWTPSWKMWLAVPPQYRTPREVTIKKPSCWNEFGFSIVGKQSGSDDKSLPVFIKYVSPCSPADLQGGLRCGDEIITINGCCVTTMTHRHVIDALKKSHASVKLTIMSWPGSVH